MPSGFISDDLPWARRREDGERIATRDGFAKDQPIQFDDRLTHITFTLENRAGSAHDTGIDIAGLPPGHYEVRSGSELVAKLEGGSANARINVPMQGPTASVSIVRQ